LPGPPGTHARALVDPEGGFVQNVGFSAIHRGGTGIYCLFASGINPAEDAPVVSGAAGLGSESDVPVAVVYARQPPPNCNPGEFEVKTYDLSSGHPAPSEVAFTIIVP
jgi:hypothetical protein